MSVERYWQIEKVNLKHNIPVHLLVCLALLCLSPLLMGVSNLETEDTAKVLEMYVALIGIVLIPPVFLPEQNREIRELVGSKYMNSATVYCIRLLGNIVILALLLGGYVWMLTGNGCHFPVVKYYFGAYAGMLFFGVLGLFCYGASDNIIIGYMVPIFYYVAAVGSGDKYLKIFYPFSMVKDSLVEKGYLLLAAVVLAVGGIWLRSRKN